MIAFVFPGQGSQCIGMGEEFYREFKTVRETFEEAGDALGFDLAELCFEGKERELGLTVNSQPAILTVSVSALKVFREEIGIEPDFVAGHSLGEYTALISNGVLDFSDAVLIVRKRGEFMQDAVPVGVGSMSVVLGLGKNEVEEICLRASTDDLIVSPANFNSPNQTVISGNKEAVELASSMAKSNGAKRVMPLDVSAPFHCPLMSPAAKKLEYELQEIDFSISNIPIVTNCDAKINTDSEKIRELLVEQVVSPVRWSESVILLHDAGVRSFVELGPCSVLSGLIKRTVDGVDAQSFNRLEHLEYFRKNGV